MSFASAGSRAVALALVFLATAAASSATPRPASSGLDAALREIRMQSRQTYRYTCATGKTFSVTYLQTDNGQSFALVPAGGRTLLFVNTPAASGVKYQAGRYTWWTKGPRADLYDANAGANARPVVGGCATILR